MESRTFKEQAIKAVIESVTRFLVVEHEAHQLGETIFTAKRVTRFGFIDAVDETQAKEIARLQWNTKSPIDVVDVKRAPSGWFYV